MSIEERVNAKLKKATAYVRENKSWLDCEEERALDLIDNSRCSLERADSSIATEIKELMAEWCKENGEEEDWWENWTDADEIFFNLYDE